MEWSVSSLGFSLLPFCLLHERLQQGILLGVAHGQFRVPLHGDNPVLTRSLDGLNDTTGSGGRYAEPTANLLHSLKVKALNLGESICAQDFGQPSASRQISCMPAYVEMELL